MGGGNGQKSKTARERNVAKKQKELKQKNQGVTRAKIEKDKQALQCKICLQTFMITVKVRKDDDPIAFRALTHPM